MTDEQRVCRKCGGKQFIPEADQDIDPETVWVCADCGETLEED